MKTMETARPQFIIQRISRSPTERNIKRRSTFLMLIISVAALWTTSEAARGQQLFVSTANTIDKYNLTTGQAFYSFLNLPSNNTLLRLAASGNNLFVMSSDDGSAYSKVQVYDATTSQTLWELPTSMRSSLAASGVYLFVTNRDFASGDWSIDRYNLTTGQAIYSFLKFTSPTFPRRLAASGNRLFVLTAAAPGNSTVYEYDATTGQRLWTVPTSQPEILATSGRYLFVSNGNSMLGPWNVDRYDLTSGQAFYSFLEFPSQFPSLTGAQELAVSGNCLFVMTSDPMGRCTVYEYDATTSQWLWTRPLFGAGDLAASSGVEVSLHALKAPDLVQNLKVDSIDTPITPVVDLNKLKNQDSCPIVTQGLVADGVTPLLFRIDQTDAALISYTVNVDNPDLARHLHVFNASTKVWSRTGNGATLTFDGSNAVGFAYIDAIDPTNDPSLSGATEITGTLTLQCGTDIFAAKSFKVRRPPIILVHGYCSSSNTWSQGFLYGLAAATPLGSPAQNYADGFIKKIDYGVDGGFSGSYSNTTQDFITLSGTLDGVLANTERTLASDWAFTRYDVVAHSQGGLLTRMLCASHPFPGVSQPFKGPSNFNRGRFRRIITVGTPHNGSRLVHYLSDLQSAGGLYGILPSTLMFLGVLQAKFDPFGVQIRSVNDSYRAIDPDANFNLITATIAGGKVNFGKSPLSYFLIGLTQAYLSEQTPRGANVLPSGSDGVVDLISQQGGAGTPITPMGIVLCHAPPFAFFGVGDGESETNEAQVGTTAANLLTGSKASFGPFTLPKLLDLRSDGLSIDSAVPVSAVWDIIKSQLFSPQSPTQPSGPVTFSFLMAAPPSEPVQEGNANWYAEVFGPNGVSTDGVTVTADPADPTQVTVDVDTSVVQGAVVLYAAYYSITGKLIFGQPVVVTNIAVGTTLTGITLQPAQVTSGTLNTIRLQIWNIYDNGATTGQEFISAANPAQFTSSDPSVAQVDPVTGVVTTVASGTATITGSYNGFTAQSTITVPQPGGALQVVIPATGAASVGGEWQVDGGVWQNSGVTLSGITPGTHTVTFGTISGWTTPLSETVTVNANQTTTVSGTYLAATFATWAATYGLSGSNAAPTFDPDHDGMPLLLEYALGADPTNAASNTPPAVGIEGIGDQTYMTFTYQRPTGGGRGDLTYDVEATSDLTNWGSWSNSAVVIDSITPAFNGLETVVARLVTPIGTNWHSAYMRLRVTQP